MLLLLVLLLLLGLLGLLLPLRRLHLLLRMLLLLMLLPLLPLLLRVLRLLRLLLLLLLVLVLLVLLLLGGRRREGHRLRIEGEVRPPMVLAPLAHGHGVHARHHRRLGAAALAGALVALVAHGHPGLGRASGHRR